MGERVVIFGASKGLGLALAEKLVREDPNRVILAFSREIGVQINVEKYPDHIHQFKIVSLDFTSEGAVQSAYEQLILFRPHRFFYVAGGGPYGLFHKKQWKDHEWALKLNFLFPAELFHRMARDWQRFHDLKQAVFIGSSVADHHPDPGASSYAAAKHGMRGLITTIQAENQLPVDIRWFSPGYMDTQMLPPNCTPRKMGVKISDPKIIAEQLLKWCSDTQLRNSSLIVSDQ